MIFYFSGTGNSLYTAKKIAESQGEKLVSIAECLKDKNFKFILDDNEKLGFVMPVYFFGIPEIVLNFIKKAEFINYKSNYTFAAVTCGSNSGNLATVLSKILDKKKIKLNAFFEVILPDNYILLFDLLTKEEKIKELLSNSDVKLKDINKIINEKQNLKIPSSIARTILSSLSYPIHKYGRNTKPFYATNRCTSCGLCEKVCPYGIIKLNNGKPEWTADKCTQCIACLHRCPAKAIQFGNKTAKRGRYVHPVLK